MGMIFVFLFSFLSYHAYADTAPFHYSIGVKFPTSIEEGTSPITVSVPSLSPNQRQYKGFTELLPYVMRAPDQEEAGSCLYMSLTGVAEWWMARLHPELSRTPDGPLDLSERYLMNIAGLREEQNGIANWKTDSIYLLNNAQGTQLNKNYRFTKGWYLNTNNGIIKATKTTQGASYGTSYNWVDERKSITSAPVELPIFKRDVLFADPESNQWNTAVMPLDIASRIKAALLKKKAPVHIIYNHYGYWHANMIVGFDDQAGNENCKFVRDFISYMNNRAMEYRAEAARQQNVSERNRLLYLAEKSDVAYKKTKASFDRNGCHTNGIFYVRDSIYADEAAPDYDYDPSARGEERPYATDIIMLEQDWVFYMANHATQIYIE